MCIRDRLKGRQPSTPEQIVRTPGEGDRLPDKGKDLAKVAKQLEIS